MTSAPPDSLARLNLDATGKILVPNNPETARIRLAELEASPGYLDAILNPMPRKGECGRVGAKVRMCRQKPVPSRRYIVSRAAPRLPKDASMTNPVPALPAPPYSLDGPTLSPADARRVAEILSPFVTRQQNFIRAIATGSAPTQAVKSAGYSGKLVKLTAKRLLAEPAVVKAIDDLREVLANQSLYDFERAHNTLLAALDFARQTNNANAMVKAAETLAKLHGHLTDKLDLNANGGVSFVFPTFTPKSHAEAPHGPALIEAHRAE
jgi:hypothetical protein